MKSLYIINVQHSMLYNIIFVNNRVSFRTIKHQLKLRNVYVVDQSPIFAIKFPQDIFRIGNHNADCVKLTHVSGKIRSILRMLSLLLFVDSKATFLLSSTHVSIKIRSTLRMLSLFLVVGSWATLLLFAYELVGASILVYRANLILAIQSSARRQSLSDCGSHTGAFLSLT